MFRSKTCRFRHKRLLKIGTTLNDPQNYPKHLTSQVSCIHWILIPEPKFHSDSLYDQPFSRYKIVENRKCTEWPQNNLKFLTVKSTLYTLNTHPKAQVWNDSKEILGRSSVLKFLLPWGIMLTKMKNHKTWCFSKVSFLPWFSLQVKFERNARNRFWDNCNTDSNGDDGRRADRRRTTDKTLSFFLSVGVFVRTIGRKIPDKFENFWLRFVGGVAFWNCHSHWVSC